MFESKNNNNAKDESKYIRIAWNKIQTNLNALGRRIIALKYIIQLIKSSEMIIVLKNVGIGNVNMKIYGLIEGVIIMDIQIPKDILVDIHVI